MYPLTVSIIPLGVTVSSVSYSSFTSCKTTLLLLLLFILRIVFFLYHSLACHCEIMCIKYHSPMQVFKEVDAFFCLCVSLFSPFSAYPLLPYSPKQEEADGI